MGALRRHPSKVMVEVTLDHDLARRALPRPRPGGHLAESPRAAITASRCSLK
jgi:hypothetical protein